MARVFKLHSALGWACSILNDANLDRKLGSVGSNNCFVNVGDSHRYMEILSHDASKLWDQCLHFEIKCVCLSLALKLNGLAIQCPRSFP